MAAAAPALLIQDKKLVYISFPAPDGNSEGGSGATLGRAGTIRTKYSSCRK
jgi:hypothetical protein